MVKTMSVASLCHHEGRRNKSLYKRLFAFMFPFCNICSHLIFIVTFASVVHVHMKLENNAGEYM